MKSYVGLFLLAVCDEELIIMIQRGDNVAFDVLFLRYCPIFDMFVNEIINAYKSLRAYSDEVMNCAVDAFSFGVKNYVFAENTSFHKYWKGIAKNKTLNFYKKSRVTIFTFVDPTLLDNSYIRMYDSGSYSEEMNVEQLRADVREVLRKNRYEFSNDQYRIIGLTLIGYSVQEICETFKYKKGKVYRDRNSAIAILSKLMNKR